MSHVAFYITGHGFGHATRMIAVAGAMTALAPDVQLTFITTVPESLFRLNLSGPFRLRPRALDVGVIQHDSLRLDPAATLAAYARLMDRQPATLEEEARFLRREGVDLVVADIPPAAFPVAQRAELPGVGISNFSWDWIYAEYVRELPGYTPLLEAIRDAYARADLFLRLPFHGGCDAYKRIRDIPMIARRSRQSREEIRGLLGLNGSRPVILLSFGGFEVHGIDFDRVEALQDYCFLVTQPPPRPIRNVQVVRLGAIKYEDLVAQADAVITKPGYGIVSDCLANRTPVLYTSRGQFAEYQCLVEGLERFGVSAFIENRDLLAGNWRGSLEALLRQPRAWAELPTNGAEVAADLLRAFLPHG
ncbi:MAG TPA: hypothetical protein VLT62_21235 [Candidatus Methylomirabilis sp.]|nr:hypothetical protein [Candidatus Methylomirabilis sp.]